MCHTAGRVEKMCKNRDVGFGTPLVWKGGSKDNADGEIDGVM
jgi:hypothetical protein